MKKIVYFLIVAGAVSACNASGDNGNTMPELSKTLLENYKPDTNKPVSLIPDSTLPLQPTISGGGTNVKLNPAHGQPGHDCAVAVGAPLNKAVTTGTQTLPKTVSNPSITSPAITQPAANTNSATGKLNPAHGQPGHRCDIAVGQPLSSTPSTPAVNPVSTTTPVNTNPLPAQPATTQPASPFPSTAK